MQYQKAIDNFDIKKENKIESMLLIVARFCYFVLSTYWAIQISYGQPWLPKALGGLGTESFFANKYSRQTKAGHDLYPNPDTRPKHSDSNYETPDEG